MPKKLNSPAARVRGKVVRRVVAIGPDGADQIRLDIDGTKDNPKLHVYCTGRDPVAMSQEGEDLHAGKARGRFRGTVIRNVKSVGWNGGDQVRLDVGGNRRKPQFLVFMDADHPLAALGPGDRFAI